MNLWQCMLMAIPSLVISHYYHHYPFSSTQYEPVMSNCNKMLSYRRETALQGAL